MNTVNTNTGLVPANQVTNAVPVTAPVTTYCASDNAGKIGAFTGALFVSAASVTALLVGGRKVIAFGREIAPKIPGVVGPIMGAIGTGFTGCIAAAPGYAGATWTRVANASGAVWNGITTYGQMLWDHLSNRRF